VITINEINTIKLILPWFILWGAISLLIGYLWRKFMGIDVYICHTGGYDDNLKKMKKEMENVKLTLKPKS